MGVLYHQWVSMGGLELTTPYEFDLLKKASSPGFHQKLMHIASNEDPKIECRIRTIRDSTYSNMTCNCQSDVSR